MSKKIVIVGGGIAGLSAGIYGQMNGFDTEIIEKHTIAGGQCTAWTRKGYRFDYCLHWLVGSSQGPFYDIWKETGVIDNRTQIVNHETYLRMEDESGNDFIIYTQIDQWEKYLTSFAPEDTRAIKKMCNDMRKMSHLQPFRDAPEVRSCLVYIQALLKMGPAIRLLMKYGKRTFSEYLQELQLKNERLSWFFNKLYGEQDMSALAFIMMLSWFNQKNAGYLMGGSRPMIERMEERYRSLGGTLTLGSTVSKIMIENEQATGVSLNDGRIIKGDYVISAADGRFTLFEMLGGNYLSDEIKEAYQNWGVFTPIVQVSFGIDKAISLGYPAQTFIAPDKKIGFTTLDQGYIIMNYAFDPTMAPEGKTVIVIRFASPWENWNGLSKEAYKSEKATIEAETTALLERHFPEVKGHIEEIDVATPITDVRYTGVWKGAYEGFVPTSKNITKSLKMTLPKLKNFYMAGQWLFPGGGLPPSAQSGKWVMQLICKNEKTKFKVS